VVQQREGGLRVSLDVGGQAGRGRVGQDPLAGVGDQCPLDPEQGVGGHLAVGVVGSGVGLGGQLCGQGIGGGGEGVVFAGLERGAGGDHPVQGPQAFQGLGVAGVGLGEQASGGEQEAAEGGQHRLAGRAGGDGFQEVGFEGFQGGEEEGFLGGEVVEHGGHRDLGLPGDVGDGDLVEAVVGEQSPRDLGDVVAGLGLFAFAESHGGAP
jgi:hypothetical protein